MNYSNNNNNRQQHRKKKKEQQQHHSLLHHQIYLNICSIIIESAKRRRDTQDPEYRRHRQDIDRDTDISMGLRRESYSQKTISRERIKRKEYSITRIKGKEKYKSRQIDRLISSRCLSLSISVSKMICNFINYIKICKLYLEIIPVPIASIVYEKPKQD